MKTKLTITFLCILFTVKIYTQVPEGFVDVSKYIPSIILDMRYVNTHNFLGVPVDGYNAPKCYLTKEAALALKKVQDELTTFGLSLKIYDGYRPQRAVDHFVRWAKALDDTLTKREFYPTVDKKDLFRDGYISSKSGHSRGSTVDLTIVSLPLSEQESYSEGQKLCECYLHAEKRFKDNSIDMGTGFDCFHENSWTQSENINAEQRAHRMLLKTIMAKYGFRNYEKEWWHYTLI
ncbi:MAG: D-alanyl-D-alanine dipeptidase, partial [Ignavibacteria bacterium RBG_13_36_8]